MPQHNVNDLPARRTVNCYRSPLGESVVRAWCESRLAEDAPRGERALIDTSAGSTHVFSSPEPSGPAEEPVVIIPGTNANAATSVRLFHALAAQRRTIVLDVPGQPGLSGPLRSRSDRLTWYGTWLSQSLEQVAPAGAVVVGHSLGGAIALASDSRLISKRVLVAPAGVVSLRVSARTLWATLGWLSRPSPAGSRMLLEQFFGPGHTVPEDLVEWYTLVAANTRSSMAPAVLPREVLARRRGTPIAIATGEHDTFLPPRRLAAASERRLDTPVQVIAGAGHLVIDEVPAAIAALIGEESVQSYH